MRDDSDPRPRRKVSVHLTVRAAFTHFPGCCPDPIATWITGRVLQALEAR